MAGPAGRENPPEEGQVKQRSIGDWLWTAVFVALAACVVYVLGWVTG